MINIFKNGRIVARSKNLACVVRYSKERSPLRGFEIEPPSAERRGVYTAKFCFEDGAEAFASFHDWRVAVSFLARGARRANGPFPSRLEPTADTPQHIQSLFFQLRDMPKGGGRGGGQYAPTKAEREVKGETQARKGKGE